MEDRLIAYRQRKERMQEYKEAAAKGCYSLILIVVTLVLLRPVMVNQMLGLASAYSGAGLLDESMRQCDKALLLDGQSSGAWYQSARVYRLQGNREMACGAYQEAAQIDPSNRLARLELAAMYIEDGRYQLAIPYLEQVRRLGPDTASQTGRPGTSCHRASLEMLIQCYQHEKDPAKLEMVRKEANIFYPSSVQIQPGLNASSTL
ncbi:MAG: tetratricopeptide repeat protein [Planctomycetes bacterium]|nr:tetratricopeptide repeat protein [Planctomycetota bacterium]